MYLRYQSSTDILRLIDSLRAEPVCAETDSALNNLLEALISHNVHHDAVQLLLTTEPRCHWNTKGFHTLCANGSTEMVRLLLGNPNVTLTANELDVALGSAAYDGHDAIVRLLLADPRLNVASASVDALAYAVSRGHMTVMETLLADERIDPNAHNGRALFNAVTTDDTALLYRLLEDKRVDCAFDDCSALKQAARYGKCAAVTALINNLVEHWPGDRAVFYRRAIKAAAVGGQVENLRWLLERMDSVEAYASRLVECAVESEEAEIVRMVLTKYTGTLDQGTAAAVLSDVVKTDNELLVTFLLEDGRFAPTLHTAYIAIERKQLGIASSILKWLNEKRREGDAGSDEKRRKIE